MRVSTIASLAGIAATSVAQFTRVIIPANQTEGTTIQITIDTDVTLTAPLENSDATTSPQISLTGDPMSARPMQTMTVVCMNYDEPCGCPDGVDFCVPVYPDTSALPTTSSNDQSGNGSYVVCTPQCLTACPHKTWDHGYGGDNTPVHTVCSHTTDAAGATTTACHHAATTQGPCETTCSTTCWTKITDTPTSYPMTTSSIHPAGTVYPTTTVMLSAVNTAGAPSSFGVKESLATLAGVSALMLLFA